MSLVQVKEIHALVGHEHCLAADYSPLLVHRSAPWSSYTLDIKAALPRR